MLTIPCNVQENERLAEEVDQMRTGGRAADAREYRSKARHAHADSSTKYRQTAWRVDNMYILNMTSAGACELGMSVCTLGSPVPVHWQGRDAHIDLLCSPKCPLFFQSC